MWLSCVGASLIVSVATFWGLGGLLHHHFYVRRREAAPDWKLQPARWLSKELVRMAFLLGSANILLGSLLGGSFAWYILGGGRSSLYFHVGEHGWPWLVASALLTYFAIDAGLYYTHRLLHHKKLFRFIHRHHHRFVAPIVFCTTAMHPLEFLIFFSAVLLPALIIPVHVGVYLAMVGYTYLIGMIDHAGVRLSVGLPFHADNAFHDEHHICFHCNYGHHTALFDRLHGTARRPDRQYGEEIFH